MGCGSVITASTTLTADVADCTGDALTIGARGVTLDLGGFTVSSIDGVGIRSAGPDYVTIKNGTVQGATTGIAMSDAYRAAISNVDAVGGEGYDPARDTLIGVSLQRVERSAISDSSANGMDGLVMRDSHNNRVTRTTGSGGPDNDVQVRLVGSDNNTFSDNSFVGGGYENVVLTDSHDNTFDNNALSGSNGGPIMLVGSNRNRIRWNTTGSECCGIEIVNSADNLVQGNVGTGGPDTGISVWSSIRTTVVGNQVASIAVDGSARTTVRGNVLAPEWDDDGIFVAADSTRTELRGNVVTGFADDGIDVEAPGTILRGNTTNDNGDLGIEAVAGVIDRGGNQASGNGNPLQCVNVTCS